MVSSVQIERTYNSIVYKDVLKKLILNLELNPNRFISKFTGLSIENKIRKFLMQSIEIKVGMATEEILKILFEAKGYKLEEKSIIVNGKRTEIDLLFKKRNKFILIELKMRDDHDSTKQQVMIQDFNNKIKYLNDIHGKNLKAILYFVDDGIKRNKKFYLTEIDKLQDKYPIEICLLYGKELFENEKQIELWDVLEEYFEKKNSSDIIIDYDGENNEYSETSFGEIKDIPINVWLNLLNNDVIATKVLPIIFPSTNVGGVLNLLRLYFKEKYKELWYESISKSYNKAYLKLDELFEKLDYKKE